MAKRVIMLFILSIMILSLIPSWALAAESQLDLPSEEELAASFPDARDAVAALPEPAKTTPPAAPSLYANIIASQPKIVNPVSKFFGWLGSKIKGAYDSFMSRSRSQEETVTEETVQTPAETVSETPSEAPSLTQEETKTTQTKPTAKTSLSSKVFSLNSYWEYAKKHWFFTPLTIASLFFTPPLMPVVAWLGSKWYGDIKETYFPKKTASTVAQEKPMEQKNAELWTVVLNLDDNYWEAYPFKSSETSMWASQVGKRSIQLSCEKTQSVDVDSSIPYNRLACIPKGLVDIFGVQRSLPIQFDLKTSRNNAEITNCRQVPPTINGKKQLYVPSGLPVSESMSLVGKGCESYDPSIFKFPIKGTVEYNQRYSSQEGSINEPVGISGGRLQFHLYAYDETAQRGIRINPVVSWAAFKTVLVPSQNLAMTELPLD